MIRSSISIQRYGTLDNEGNPQLPGRHGGHLRLLAIYVGESEEPEKIASSANVHYRDTAGTEDLILLRVIYISLASVSGEVVYPLNKEPTSKLSFKLYSNFRLSKHVQPTEFS
jgi:hypothetical protein